MRRHGGAFEVPVKEVRQVHSRLPCTGSDDLRRFHLQCASDYWVCAVSDQVDWSQQQVRCGCHLQSSCPNTWCAHLLDVCLKRLSPAFESVPESVPESVQESVPESLWHREWHAIAPGTGEREIRISHFPGSRFPTPETRIFKERKVGNLDFTLSEIENPHFSRM